MPIQVACSACAGKFRVPDNVAGKKIRCPKCKEVIQVPASDAAAAEVPAPTSKPTPSASQPASQPKPATPAPALATPTAAKTAKPALENWYLKTEDGESYGPVPRAELDAWYAEGRVTIDCQVLREGSDQWQWASELYPELDPASAAKVVPTTPEVAETPVEKPVPAPKPIVPTKPVEPATPAASTKAATPAKPTTPARPQTAAGPASTPAKEESASPMSFFPPDEPAETAPAADEDNPFGFLGASGGGSAGGGDAFNFSAAPSTASGAATPKAAKITKKAAAATSSSASAADSGEVSSKSKLTAGLLAIFLGSLGVHRFYLGYTVLGVVQLLLCGGCGIWQIIDVFLIFTGKLPDAQGKPLKG